MRAAAAILDAFPTPTDFCYLITTGGAKCNDSGECEDCGECDGGGCGWGERDNSGAQVDVKFVKVANVVKVVNVVNAVNVVKLIKLIKLTKLVKLVDGLLINPQGDC